jgi:hypothetical protein
MKSALGVEGGRMSIVSIMAAILGDELREHGILNANPA